MTTVRKTLAGIDVDGEERGWNATRYNPATRNLEGVNIADVSPLYMSDLECPNGVDVLDLALFGFSDYSGCAVERANRQAFMEQFPARDWYRPTVGGHGSAGLVLILDAEIDAEDGEALKALLEGLASYPCADDDLLSEIEREAEREAWEDWGRSDFRRLLGDSWDERDDADVDSAFEAAREAANEYWQIETGGGAWIDLKRVAAKVPA
jgi:hypothetical protein